MMFTPTNVEIARSEIATTANFLEIPVSDITIRTPPLVDDFDSAARITWEGFHNNERVGGFWSRPVREGVTDAEMRRTSRRNSAFGLLVNLNPARRFIKEAIRVFRPRTDDMPDVLVAGRPRGEPELLAAIIEYRARMALASIEDVADLPTENFLIGQVLGTAILAVTPFVRDALETKRRMLELDRKDDL